MSEQKRRTIEIEIDESDKEISYRFKGTDERIASEVFASHLEARARELLKPKVLEFKRDLAVTFARIVWPWASGEPDHRDWESLCVHKDRADRALELAEASIASMIEELEKQAKEFCRIAADYDKTGVEKYPGCYRDCAKQIRERITELERREAGRDLLHPTFVVPAD